MAQLVRYRRGNDKKWTKDGGSVDFGASEMLNWISYFCKVTCADYDAECVIPESSPADSKPETLEKYLTSPARTNKTRDGWKGAFLAALRNGGVTPAARNDGGGGGGAPAAKTEGKSATFSELAKGATLLAQGIGGAALLAGAFVVGSVGPSADFTHQVPKPLAAASGSIENLLEPGNQQKRFQQSFGSFMERPAQKNRLYNALTQSGSIRCREGEFGYLVTALVAADWMSRYGINGRFPAFESLSSESQQELAFTSTAADEATLQRDFSEFLGTVPELCNRVLKPTKESAPVTVDGDYTRGAVALIVAGIRGPPSRKAAKKRRSNDTQQLRAKKQKPGNTGGVKRRVVMSDSEGSDSDGNGDGAAQAQNISAGGKRQRRVDISDDEGTPVEPPGGTNAEGGLSEEPRIGLKIEVAIRASASNQITVTAFARKAFSKENVEFTDPEAVNFITAVTAEVNISEFEKRLKNAYATSYSEGEKTFANLEETLDAIEGYLKGKHEELAKGAKTDKKKEYYGRIFTQKVREINGYKAQLAQIDENVDLEVYRPDFSDDEDDEEKAANKTVESSTVATENAAQNESSAEAVVEQETQALANADAEVEAFESNVRFAEEEKAWKERLSGVYEVTEGLDSDGLKERIAELETALTGATRAAYRANAMLDKLRAERTKNDGAIVEAMNKVASETAKVKQLEENLKASEAKVRNLLAQARESGEVADELARQLEQANSDATKALAELGEARTVEAKARNNLKFSQLKAGRLAKERDAATKELQAAIEQEGATQDALQQSKSLLKAVQEDVVRLEGDLRKARGSAAEQEQLRTTLEQDYGKLLNLYYRTDDERDATTAKLREELKKALARADQLSNDLGKYQMLGVDLDRRWINARLERDEARKGVEEETALRESFDELYAEAKQDLNEALGLLEASERDLGNLETNLRQTEKANEKQTTQLNKVNDKLSAAQEDVRKKKEELKKLKAELGRVNRESKSQLGKAKKATDAVSARLAKAEKKADAVQKDLATMKGERDAARASARVTLEDLGKTREMYATLRSQALNLTGMLMKTKTELSVALSEVSTAKNLAEQERQRGKEFYAIYQRVEEELAEKRVELERAVSERNNVVGLFNEALEALDIAQLEAANAKEQLRAAKAALRERNDENRVLKAKSEEEKKRYRARQKKYRERIRALKAQLHVYTESPQVREFIGIIQEHGDSVDLRAVDGLLRDAQELSLADIQAVQAAKKQQRNNFPLLAGAGFIMRILPRSGVLPLLVYVPGLTNSYGVQSVLSDEVERAYRLKFSAIPGNDLRVLNAGDLVFVRDPESLLASGELFVRDTGELVKTVTLENYRSLLPSLRTLPRKATQNALVGLASGGALLTEMRGISRAFYYGVGYLTDYDFANHWVPLGAVAVAATTGFLTAKAVNYNNQPKDGEYVVAIKGAYDAARGAPGAGTL